MNDIKDMTDEAAIARIASYMADVSVEATRPSASEIETVAGILPKGTELYLTALPNRPVEEIVATSKLVVASGLVPVAHVAARQHRDMASVDRLLTQLREAGVTRILLIGGDMAPPGNAVHDALSVIESGVIAGKGFETVGLPGFPDGHPNMADEELESTLVTKLAALQSLGVEPHIVTQFCFDAEPIVRWLGWLRQRGIHAPVRVGFAGPTSLMAWLNLARKCGVKASAEALAKRSGLVKAAFKSVAPDPLVRVVADATAGGKLGDVKAHIFSFGGLAATSRWAKAPVEGRIRLTREGGFDNL